MPVADAQFEQPDTLRVHDRLAEVPAHEWNRLAGNHPFLRHAYLNALETTGCASVESGWQPCHLTLWRAGRLVGAMPLYLKYHSYGEYVFDWAWAQAYERAGLSYYPKLLCAIPFTPVAGPRLLAQTPADQQRLLRAALDIAGADEAISSLHLLFPDENQMPILAREGLMPRSTVQFHWQNAAYADFDAFVAEMSHDKRKKIKQDRRKVRDAGIRFEWRCGTDITDAHWQFFTECYTHTYRLHRSTPYLNLAFFREIGRTMPEHCLMILGYRDGQLICAALDILSDDTLYGRYWGALEYHPCLHFEVCYYQAIEFCIARGLQHFEGGAQGEHKLARGLLPVETHSGHWLKHPAFSNAVADFLKREGTGVSAWLNELNEHSPFARPADE